MRNLKTIHSQALPAFGHSCYARSESLSSNLTIASMALPVAATPSRLSFGFQCPVNRPLGWFKRSRRSHKVTRGTLKVVVRHLKVKPMSFVSLGSSSDILGIFELRHQVERHMMRLTSRMLFSRWLLKCVVTVAGEGKAEREGCLPTLNGD